MKYISALLLVLFSGFVQAAGKPLNVLFILTDNQPASILGAYGNGDVKTPNIDRLAKEGMRFTHAFAVNGMCSPTRATLMTGLMPSQHGVHNWLDDSLLEDWPRDWSAIAEYRTLPLTLANRGYHTAMIGKWHLGQPWKASVGFQHWVTFTEGHTMDFWHNTIIDNGSTYSVDDEHVVGFFAGKAVEYIEDLKGDRPFYLQLNFNGPYLNPPTNLGPARNRHYREYQGKEFGSFPRVAFNDNVVQQLLDPDTPDFLRKKHLQAIAMHNDPATMANVASQNTVVDDAVGRVLKVLDDTGLAESTLVIFSSDQGNFYGQHGLWQHTVVTNPSNLYEAALNIPLIIRHPGYIDPGSANKQLIAQYDLPVTILDYLGLDVVLENSPGKSFVGQLRGEDKPGRKAVFYEQEESRGIRTDRFAYWKRLREIGGNALYDMSADPGQIHNLVDDPAYNQTIDELEEALEMFFSSYSSRKYDLWKGGVAKGSVTRPGTFQSLYGADWKPRTDLVKPFKELRP